MVIEPQFDDANGFSDGLARIKSDGKYGYIELLTTAEKYIKSRVVPEINAWQVKGEFESTAMWRERVNEQTRQAKIDLLAAKYRDEYFNILVNRRKEQFKTANFKLMSYDADNESYMIKTDAAGDILLSVPLSVAPSFKENWGPICRNIEPQYTPS